MNKQKIAIIVLAIVLLAGLIATKQARWTPGKKTGVPLEKYLQGDSTNQGNNQQNNTQSQGDQEETQANKTKKDSKNPQDNPHEEANMEVETNKAGFPKKIADLKLSEFLSGQQAIESINKLHGTKIDVVNGYVARYGANNENKKVEIWVSEAKSEQAAAKQIEVMTKRIMEGSDTFSKPSVMQIKGTKFFQTKGMGMSHYYYKKGKKSYWISVKGVKEAAIMGLIFRVL